MGGRYVVTGATGFVGSCLTKHLLNHGAVLGVSRTQPAFTARNFQHLAADIRMPLPDVGAFQDAVVIHAAAVINSTDPVELWQGNVDGTFHVLQWALRHKARHIIVFSTGGVYRYADNHAWDEQEAVEPIGFYGHTKLLAENAARAYHALHGLPVTVLRLFFPYGAGQTRGILPLISNSIANGKALTVHQRGAPRINPIHMDDVASAIDRLLPRKDGYRVFNLCGDEVFSFEDLIQLFESKHGRRAVIHRSGQAHGDLLGDNGLLKKDLEWNPVRKLAA